MQERTCGCQTGGSAEQAQQHSLQEKCPANIMRLCAERQQNADLPCFLVSGSQHASHHTDERDKQCYRTDGGNQADSHALSVKQLEIHQLFYSMSDGVAKIEKGTLALFLRVTLYNASLDGTASADHYS